MLHYYETFNKIVELFLCVFLEIALLEVGNPLIVL